MFDLVIRGGTVVDGTGGPSRGEDVGIANERIAAIGDLRHADARRTIDASDRIVAPGFIDTHVHSDVMLLSDSQHASGLRQGITTEILGQDGMSYAPLSPANLQIYRRYLAGINGDPEVGWDWSNIATFRARFDRAVAINTAYLIPHGTVRLEAVGFRDVPLVGAALGRAKRLIAEGMEQGAVGFSTGLSYYPASYSDTEELVELCSEIAPRDGVFVTHVRSVFRGEPFDPVEEALRVAERAGIPVHFSHTRTAVRTAGRTSEILGPIEAARSRGLDITLELYPYPTGSGFLLYYMPLGMHEGGPDAIVERLNDPQTHPRLMDEMSAQYGEYWEQDVLTYVRSEQNAELVGLRFTEAAARRGTSVEEMMVDLWLEEDLAVGFHGGTPTDLDAWEQVNRDAMELLAQPYYMVGSDAIPAHRKPHPRTYGCFPRFLGRFRRRYGGLSLEAMVNRMTAVPAERFGLKDRGTIQVGRAADLVIFDPERIEDRATYDDPLQYPSGIPYVIVNGQVAVDEERCTGVMAGRAL